MWAVHGQSRMCLCFGRGQSPTHWPCLPEMTFSSVGCLELRGSFISQFVFQLQTVQTVPPVQKSTHIITNKTSGRCCLWRVTAASQSSEVTELQVVWPHLVLLRFQKAYSRVQRFGELVMSPVEHRRHGCREFLQDNHGVCIVENQLALVIIHPHSHFSKQTLADPMTHHMAVVVPSPQVPVPELHTPWVPVAAQFGTLVPALSLQAGVRYTHSPGSAAAYVDLPVAVTGCNGWRAQSATHLIKLQRVLRSGASTTWEEHSPPLWSHRDLTVASVPVCQHRGGIWNETEDP